MKILYGVQGTGNGHIARARIMAAASAQRDDIQVDFVFSGRSPEQYFDMDIFGQYRTLPGLSFVTRHGRVDKLATLRHNQFCQFMRDVRQLDVSGYDLLINDFEPVTAWAAKRQGLTAISISHQAAFAYKVPKSGETLLDRLLIRFFAPADMCLGVHWYHFNQPILPPFISDRPAAQASPGHVLVYLPFEDLDDIKKMLEPLSNQVFKCYHPAIKQPLQSGHVHWYPPSRAGFACTLQQCQGVIANGGFELSSEALHLGKKLLIKPLHGQFEQLSNVATLSQLGLCDTLSCLDTAVVTYWLKAPANEAITFPDNPEVLIDWLKAGNFDDPYTLCQTLWQQVRYGEKTRQKLLSLAI